MSKKAKFLVSDKFFRIISEDENHNKGTAKPKCEVLTDGNADSIFAIEQLLAINSTIGKSNEATLSLDMHQPMVLDLNMDEMKVKYYINEKE